LQILILWQWKKHQARKQPAAKDMGILDTSYYHAPPPEPNLQEPPRETFSEVPNGGLTAFYFLNLVFALLAIALATGQLYANDTCDQNCQGATGSAGTFFFAMAIIVLVVAFVAVGMILFGLLANAGYRLDPVPKKKVRFEEEPAPLPSTLQDALPGLDESDLIMKQRPDMVGYRNGMRSELSAYLA
jgi:hypothetical protein